MYVCNCIGLGSAAADKAIDSAFKELAGETPKPADVLLLCGARPLKRNDEVFIGSNGRPTVETQCRKCFVELSQRIRHRIIPIKPAGCEKN